MSETRRIRLRVGDPVRLKDSSIKLRGDVWQLHAEDYLVVRWQDACCSTHHLSALEYDYSRGRADWSRNLTHEDRQLQSRTAAGAAPALPSRTGKDPGKDAHLIS